MNWTKKWSEFKGCYEHFSDDELISIFKDVDGYKYRFLPSVMTKKSSGYATSIHFWRSLSGVKSYLEKNTHFMVVITPDNEKDYVEYVITGGKIVKKCS